MHVLVTLDPRAIALDVPVQHSVEFDGEVSMANTTLFWVAHPSARARRI